MATFRQRDVTDCGATCLSYILYHYKLAVSVALVRQKAGTSQRGTTALGLIETAEAFGMNAKGVKCVFENLGHLSFPCIAHVVVDGRLHHYVVLCRVTKKWIEVMDPAVGRKEKWSPERFRAAWSGVVVLMTPGVSFSPGQKDRSSAGRLWQMVVPQKAIVLQAFVGAVLGTILALSSSIYVQKIVDNVLVEGNRNLLNLLGLMMLAVIGCRLVLGYFQSLLIMRAAQKIDVALILGYYRHLLRLPQPFFDTMRVGEITSRIRDAVRIRAFLNGTVISLMLNPLLLIFGFSAMFYYSWRIALFSMALLPLNLGIYLALDWRNKKYQRRIMEGQADFDSHLVESLHAMSVVKSFRLEEKMSLVAESRLVRLLKTTWSAGQTGLIVGSAGGLITQIYSVGLLWIGASQVLETNLSPGELMSCHALAGYLTGPIIGLIGLNTSIREALVATDRLYEVMELEREKEDGEIELDPQEAATLVLDKVTFKYPGRLPALKEVSLAFQPGQITALVGESGCGKSTLLALLQRNYPPTGGRILLGSHDLADIKVSSLRTLIAVVPQRIELLSGTIVENLAPRSFKPDLGKLTELCRDVGILEFIESLPQGFNTHVTENGSNFSGGQRQRLAIVRAMMADAPIVLMDEPSSALDPAAEEVFLRAMIEMRSRGKLLIVATHNERIVAAADHVVHLQKGCVLPASSSATATVPLAVQEDRWATSETEFSSVR